MAVGRQYYSLVIVNPCCSAIISYSITRPLANHRVHCNRAIASDPGIPMSSYSCHSSPTHGMHIPSVRHHLDIHHIRTSMTLSCARESMLADFYMIGSSGYKSELAIPVMGSRIIKSNCCRLLCHWLHGLSSMKYSGLTNQGVRAATFYRDCVAVDTI